MNSICSTQTSPRTSSHHLGKWANIVWIAQARDLVEGGEGGVGPLPSQPSQVQLIGKKDGAAISQKHHFIAPSCFPIPWTLEVPLGHYWKWPFPTRLSCFKSPGLMYVKHCISKEQRREYGFSQIAMATGVVSKLCFQGTHFYSFSLSKLGWIIHFFLKNRTLSMG